VPAAPEYPEPEPETVKYQPIQGIANRIRETTGLALCLVAGSNAHLPSRRSPRVVTSFTMVATNQATEDDCRTQQPWNKANHLIQKTTQRSRYSPPAVVPKQPPQ